MQTMNNQYLGWDETHAKHRYCLRHVASNFNTRFKNVGLKNLLINAGTVTKLRNAINTYAYMFYIQHLTDVTL